MSSTRAVLLLTTMLATLVVASGVAMAAAIQCQTETYCHGTNSGDTLYGTDGHNEMYGEGGDDTMYGLAGPDELYGQRGGDTLYGDADPDIFVGGPGNDASYGGGDGDFYVFDANNWGKDTIIDTAISDPNPVLDNWITFTEEISKNLRIDLRSDASAPEVTNAAGTSTVNWSSSVIETVNNYSSGNDRVFGNDAANRIFSHNGVDQVYGYGGDDVIFVDDGSQYLSDDTVDCGDGYDTVYYDGFSSTTLGDTVAYNCEVLNPR